MYWVNTNLNHRPATSYATAAQSRLRLAPSSLRLRTSLTCLRLGLLARRTQGNTKAVEDAVRRHEPAAARRPTILGGAVPTAATEHAVRAPGAPGVSHATTRVIPIPILAPLPNIAVHVIQTPSIRFFAAYWMSIAVRVVVVPTVIS